MITGPSLLSLVGQKNNPLMNRLFSLQITDLVYRLTMLSIVYADNIEAVDSESDDGRGATLLISHS